MPELVHALALTISIAIDAQSADTYAVSPEDPPASTTPPAEPEPPPDRQAALPRPKTQQAVTAPKGGLRWSLGAGIGGTLGAGPRPLLGARGLVSAQFRNVALGLEGHFDPKQATTLSGQSVDSSAFRANLAPCWAPPPWRLCGILELGQLSVVNSNTSEGGSGLTLAAGGRAGLDVQLTQALSLRLQFDLLTTLLRVAVRVGPERVWMAPPVSGATSLLFPIEF
jgi:hypothetical protein